MTTRSETLRCVIIKSEMRREVVIQLRIFAFYLNFEFKRIQNAMPYYFSAQNYENVESIYDRLWQK